MKLSAALRQATRDAHDRVDSRFARFDLRDRDHYRHFLALHAAAFLPLEAALTECGAADVLDDWPAMRRSAALGGDLGNLGVTSVETLPPPTFHDRLELLGGLYVIEGSRLGAAVLRRAVDPSFPRRFLDDGHPPGRWRFVVAQLDRETYHAQERTRAADAALRAFAMFEAAG